MRRGRLSGCWGRSPIAVLIAPSPPIPSWWEFPLNFSVSARFRRPIPDNIGSWKKWGWTYAWGEFVFVIEVWVFFLILFFGGGVLLLLLFVCWLLLLHSLFLNIFLSVSGTSFRPSLSLSLSFLGPLWSGQDVRGVSKLTNLEIVFLRNRQMMNRNPEKKKKHVRWGT